MFMPVPCRIVCCAAIVALALVAAVHAADDRESLWTAVRNGDTKAAKALLDQGVNVNAKSEIGVTALWIAASKGKLEVIELLLEQGADVNARDGIWYQTPLSQAISNGNAELVKRLLAAGARDIDEGVRTAAARGDAAILQLLINTGKAGQDALDAALFLASAGESEVREALVKGGARPLPIVDPKDRETWAALAGSYSSDNGATLTVKVVDVGLLTTPAFGPRNIYRPLGPDVFTPIGVAESSLTVERNGGQVAKLVSKRFTAEASFFPAKPVAKLTNPSEEAAVPLAAPLNWPQFRGPDARGIADGQHPPITWDVKTGTNVRWKTPIPGLGHSCPVVWGDRVFLTTALSGDSDPKVRTGLYGDVESVDDTTKHIWQVFCLDRDTGRVLWIRTAREGVPKIKRHLKGSQANCTPATDGKRLVACFGAEGLYCYDFDGQLLWKRDLSAIDSSFSIDEEFEWGFGSSPVIYNDLVIVQFDLSHDSFLAAYSLADGSQVWSTPRDEIPSWSTPTIWRNSQRTEIVTNAAQYARGYDPVTGKELWRLAKKSEITVPTPVPAGDLVFVVSGNRPIQPIFAIKPSASADISLSTGQSGNEHIAWSKLRGGPYMPTPIVYGPHLYICSNAGVITCYDSQTGAPIYRERIGGESYTASPVAADGRLYFVSEQGEVRVVKAGAECELLAVNEMNDICMAAPAISGGLLFVRSQHFLFALGRASGD